MDAATTTITPPITEQPRLLPGDFAIWIFIFAELLVFGIAFLAYAIVRIQNVDMFNQFQLSLNREIGAANTLILITSSYFVVRAIHAIRLDHIKSCIKWLYAALACGAVFLLLKSVEYQQLFSQGISMETNAFYMFYISLTMFHFLHVILAIIILLAVAIKAQRGGYSADNYIGIESGASYWHMVDLVWIILFPLIYIIR